MKTRSKVLCMVLAVSMAVLSACASAGETAVSSETAQPQAAEEVAVAEDAAGQGAGEKTVVEVWTEDRHDMDYVQEMVDQYNASNTDGILINLTVISDDYRNMITLAYNGGTAPDVIMNNTLPLKQFSETGILMPLNDYISEDEEFQKVVEPYEHMYEGANVSDGNIYCVYSAMRTGVRVEYNKDLLAASGYDAIPDNLDDYIAMAAQITKDGNGDYYGIGFTSSSPFERLLEMVAQVSGIYYYDYVNGRYDFSGYQPILEKGRELAAIAYPDQQGVDNMRALFAEGEFALWSNASQEAGVFTNQIPITDFEWDVAPVPSLDGEVKGALQILPLKGYSIVSTSQKKDAAWKVIHFFESEEFLKGYFEKGYAKPLSGYLNEIVDTSGIGRLADFTILDYESVYPTPPAVNLQGDDYRTVMWNAVMGYVDIDEAIEDLNTRYNEALDEDVAAGTVKRLFIKDYDSLHPSQGAASYEEN